jgi:nucleotide-binding universal stress UspA family protein
MKTIVALVDFSDLTPRIVEHGSQLAKAFQGRLILLHVVPEQPAVVEIGIASPTVMQPPSAQKVEADYNYLLGLRDRLAGSGVNVLVQQLEGAGVGKLLEQCRSLEADLIVIGSHHHGALYQLFIGSFTKDVLKQATCPIYVVPAPSDQKS